MERAWGTGKTGQGDAWCNVTLDPHLAPQVPLFPQGKFKCLAVRSSSKLRNLPTARMVPALRCVMKGMTRIS